MANKLRVAVEVGPKNKRIVAFAPDWPGLERGAKTEDAAIERLKSYLPRYAKVARVARLGSQFAMVKGIDIVERYEGTGSTDFWGISFGLSEVDSRAISSSELKRELSLMRACWSIFDGVRANVSAEMKKGPRGGGRDRDRIVLHTLSVEQDWATKLGVRNANGLVVTDTVGLREIRKFRADDNMARTWPLRFLVRHTAYHTLDHAWEMEDNDLTVRESAR
jgi:hypothetical protein